MQWNVKNWKNPSRTQGALLSTLATDVAMSFLKYTSCFLFYIWQFIHSFYGTSSITIKLALFTNTIPWDFSDNDLFPQGVYTGTQRAINLHHGGQANRAYWPLTSE